ncbi:MAG: DUF4982 domain-containing protein [Butyrivibrio sp.]|nr:DUF4982 domain-containing protein [Butyrivibrio sp.]
MKQERINENWTFRRGLLDSIGMLKFQPGVPVDLPHDGMISTKVSENAIAKYDSGYFEGDVCNYAKYVFIPSEWKDECIMLQFDGAMMHTFVDVNGCKVGEHHYGYAPFVIDITDVVTFDEENRITVNLNTGTQPSSRWYTGSGLFREPKLIHGPRVHIVPDGIYVYTKEVVDDIAFLQAEIDVENRTIQNKLVEVTCSLVKEGVSEAAAVSKQVIQVNPGKEETARMAITLKNPELWSIDNPNLYVVHATAKVLGTFRSHFIPDELVTVDEQEALFGVRTITADAIRGLRINGKTEKLKGGCLHHDNGLIGAATMYEVEARKVKRLKEVGFNAIRTAHNPPSAALVEACDRLGMYIFDEAFDAWGMPKRAGDYSQHFVSEWEKDLTAFVRRDRIHPAVIMWSTGNEIPERGGLNNGYTLAKKLSDKIHSLDMSRPVSNGICSFWSGLDDKMAENMNQSQNSKDKADSNLWERYSEPFTNGLDIVGYNYMEDLYEKDHEMFPNRVILGSENFPQEIGFRWPMVEALPYVIGDFTWTAWDYIGEAGIGKALYVDKDDPLADKAPWFIMPDSTSPYPWRLANDADFDITGRMLPQGAYRSVVWGSDKTFLYSLHPEQFGKVEKMSMWGFPGVVANWNYEGYEGKDIQLVVFSGADEVEIVCNGQVIERKAVVKDGRLPNSVRFDTVYTPGKIEAISYKGGKEVSRAELVTSGKPAKLIVTSEEPTAPIVKAKENGEKAEGCEIFYVNINVVDSENRVVNDAAIELKAEVSGSGYLAGFGTGNPITDEDYTDDSTVSFRGHAQAIIRSSHEADAIKITVSAEGLEPVSVNIG